MRSATLTPVTPRMMPTFSRCIVARIMCMIHRPRQERVEFGRLRLDQEEAAKVTAVRVEEDDLVVVDRLGLLSAIQVLHELFEMRAAQVLAAGVERTSEQDCIGPP